jgi:hypothetical protein
LTNSKLIGDYGVVKGTDSVALVQENVRADYAQEVRWRDQIFVTDAAKYKGLLQLAIGCGFADCRDQFSVDIVNRQLPHHLRASIASTKCMEVVKAYCITMQEDPALLA